MPAAALPPLLRLAPGVLLAAAAAARVAGQDAIAWPAPAAGSAPERVGREHLERHDPVRALAVFRQLRTEQPGAFAPVLGLARCHLELAAAPLALRYVAVGPPDDLERAAVEVRALLRAREFDAALAAAQAALGRRGGADCVDLLAAHGSALFRLQRNDEAAAAYRGVLALDPQHIEAHVRLGSGLSAPNTWTMPARLHAGVAHARNGAYRAAAAEFAAVLAATPGHPVAHRLLGEALLALQWEASMAASAPEFAQLATLLPLPAVDEVLARQFMPAFAELTPARRRQALRALALFARHLPRLVALGARHDLLAETERTTDASARASLRGRRTFDGRVWDDVRGMGGLRAATGIEALDEAGQFGFDTLAHEIAHQAHLYGFTQVQRLKVRDLYADAKRRGAFLDYYAASNEAEYFGQGVEAFVSLAKAPGHETTHGHTRFELYRVDRALYEFVAGAVDWDPLADPDRREPLLVAAAAVALRCGRWADAVTAVEMLASGAEWERLLPRVARAALAGRPH